MAAPALQMGTGAGAATGVVNASLPAGSAVGDLLLCFAETANHVGLFTPNTTSASPTQITGSPQGTGTDNAVAATRLTAYWIIADSGTITDGSLSAKFSGAEHVWAVIGRIPAGDFDPVTPFSGTPAGNVKAVASTSTSIAGITTADANCLMVYVSTRDNDNAAANWSGQANASLTGLAETFDAGTALGNGGGLGIWTGYLASAGASGTLTATSANSVVEGFLCLAVNPFPAAGMDPMGAMGFFGA